MDENTFKPSNRRVYGSVGPMAVIVKHEDATQEKLVTVSLLNLSTTLAVIYNFGVRVEGVNSVSTRLKTFSAFPCCRSENKIVQSVLAVK